MSGLFDNLIEKQDTDLIVPNKKKPSKKSAKSTAMQKIEDDIVLASSALFESEETKEAHVKQLLKRLEVQEEREADTARVLKSKTLSLAERLQLITNKVLRVLGKQKNNILVIRDYKTLEDYISKAISANCIAIDTETNNSLDPYTCKLMGPCLYVPGDKQVYVPINHVDPNTKKLLPNQLTEEQCRVQFQRLVDANTTIIMHNGKFDYEVIKSTCHIEVPPTWDTMIAARLLDENDQAGLKYLYTTFIDPAQSKYDIESLFENVPYAYVDPDIFAYYAATDALMTYRLYEWQKAIMEAEDMERLYWVFKNIEMPIVKVTGDIELKGINVDQNFGARLSVKYTKQLTELDNDIAVELEKLQPAISAWRLTPEANERAKIYEPKKSKKSAAYIEEAYPLIDQKQNKRYKLGKPLSEQLPEVINLASPTQLAILFYDVLKVPAVSKKSPRGTGEDELKAIAEQRPDLSICALLLKRRGIVKLITTYIEPIPLLAAHYPDGRIRPILRSMGTDTGRYASGGEIKFLDEEDNQVTINSVNVQNIPSKVKEIRLLFVGETKFEKKTTDNDIFEISEIEEVEVLDSNNNLTWKFAAELSPGDLLKIEDESASAVFKQIQEVQRFGTMFKVRISALELVFNLTNRKAVDAINQIN